MHDSCQDNRPCTWARRRRRRRRPTRTGSIDSFSGVAPDGYSPRPARHDGIRDLYLVKKSGCIRWLKELVASRTHGSSSSAGGEATARRGPQGQDGGGGETCSCIVCEVDPRVPRQDGHGALRGYLLKLARSVEDVSEVRDAPAPEDDWLGFAKTQL